MKTWMRAPSAVVTHMVSARAHVNLVDRRFVVELRQLAGLGRPIRVSRRVHLDRASDRAAREHHLAAAVQQLEVIDRRVLQDFRDGVGRDVEAVERRVALDLGLEHEGLRVQGPLEAVDPVAERLREHGAETCLSVEQRQAEQVGFVVRHLLHAVREVAPVGRVSSGLPSNAALSGVRFRASVDSTSSEIRNRSLLVDTA